MCNCVVNLHAPFLLWYFSTVVENSFLTHIPPNNPICIRYIQFVEISDKDPWFVEGLRYTGEQIKVI